MSDTRRPTHIVTHAVATFLAQLFHGEVRRPPVPLRVVRLERRPDGTYERTERSL
jgi:hypothetical protein